MITVIEYESNKGLSYTEGYKKIDLHAGKGERLIWIDFADPTRDELKIFSEQLEFHPLAVEDCIHRHQRAKIDEYDRYVFLVMHALRLEQDTGEIKEIELAIFFGKGFLVTFHWEPIEVLDHTRELCRKNDLMLEKGADYLLYQVLDSIVDAYFPLLDQLDERFAAIEASIFGKPDPANLNRLFKVKRGLLHIRKVLGPQREVYSALVRHEFPYIQEQNRLYFVDINDHLLRVFDFLDTFRDVITNASEAQLSVISNRMNEIMKTLTVIATIMLPLTVITGIYGMNFSYIPELHYKYGYFAVLGVMAAITGGMIYYFRSKNWF